jgi:hypothetical protein
MKGQLYIDGKDVYTNFGLHIVEQGWNGLIQWAALKAVAYNDWHEEDGIEPDLSSPTLDSKEFTISLVGATSRSRAMAFIEAFGGNAYHTLNAASIGRNYNVRLVSAEPIREEAGIYFVDITLADDFPLRGYEPQAPSSNIERAADFLIDNMPFTDYGVRILEGSLAEITRCADVKLNLERDICINVFFKHGKTVCRALGVDTLKFICIPAASEAVILKNCKRSTFCEAVYVQNSAFFYDIV